MLESYGITEEFVGCPIRSGMETVVVGRGGRGFPVHFDRLAFEADHVLVCDRVKPHTAFRRRDRERADEDAADRPGQAPGREIYHRAIQDYSFGQIVRSVAGEVLRRCHILAGLAMVENAYDQTARIEAVAPEEFETREKELLVLAKQRMPRLPFPRVDVLLIDRIGKNISGTGMDPNVVGRKFDDHKAVEGESPKVRRIAMRGLSADKPRQRHRAGHGRVLPLAVACARSTWPPRGSTGWPRATSRRR